MGLETATYIDDLDTANPTASDDVSQGDDHIRLTKAVLQNQFTSLGQAAVTVTAAQLNQISDLLTQVPTWIAKQSAAAASTVDFTSIPSWASRITIFFDDISPTAGNDHLVQIGDASAWVTTGYASESNRIGSSGNPVTSTSGFVIGVATGSQDINGTMVLERSEASGNEWISTHNFGRNDTTQTIMGGGRLTHSAALTRIRINANGTTFSQGQLSVRYER